MAAEFITQELLLVLAFLIPGFVGVKVMFAILTAFYPALRYREQSADLVTVSVLSTVGSALTYLLYAATVKTGPGVHLGAITKFTDILGNLTIAEFLIMLIAALFLALALAAVIGSLVIVLALAFAIAVYPFNYQVAGKPLPYFSRRRFTTILFDFKDDLEESISDDRRWAVLQAAKRRRTVRLHLTTGRMVEGRLDKDMEALTAIHVLNRNGTTIIPIAQVEFVEILKRP